MTIKNSSTKHLCQTKIDRERDQSSSLKTSPISITKHLCHKCWQVSKVIWQTAASPTCHPRGRHANGVVRSWPPSNTWPTWVSPHTNGISIGSAVFTGSQTWKTDRQTHRPRYSVCSNRPHPMHCVHAMRVKNYILLTSTNTISVIVVPLLSFWRRLQTSRATYLLT